jgi:uncharacterized membrane protein YeaQ/YmgE (transglycosylase-associated protein family)
MPQPKSAGRFLLALMLCCLSAISAYGVPSDSFAHQSIRDEEKIMSFVAWVVIGLTAGFIGSQLVNRRRKGILPDSVVGLVGAIAGGWLYYTFGPPSVSGLNLSSLFTAFLGSLAFLLVYYALKRI